MRRAELGLLVNNETLLWRPVLDAALRLAQRYTVKQATPSYDVEDVMAIGGKTALIISTDGLCLQHKCELCSSRTPGMT